MHKSVLVYGGYRFLKISAGLIAVAVIAFVVHSPLGPPNGGTWLGYGLGGISAALIVWLTWYGIRKRRYGPGTTKLEAWLSAHIYLGVALIVTATLHTGFQFGLNVHTLAYVLMWLVILSGVAGVFIYLRVPEEMTANRGGQTRAETLLQISEIGEECQKIAMGLSENLNRAVFEATRQVRVGGNFLQQLSGRDRRCPIVKLSERVEAIAVEANPAEARDYFRLVSALSRQQQLLQRVRRDVRLQALLQVWLFIHVPFALALLVALVAHIISVFFYW